MRASHSTRPQVLPHILAVLTIRSLPLARCKASPSVRLEMWTVTLDRLDHAAFVSVIPDSALSDPLSLLLYLCHFSLRSFLTVYDTHSTLASIDPASIRYHHLVPSLTDCLSFRSSPLIFPLVSFRNLISCASYSGTNTSESLPGVVRVTIVPPSTFRLSSSTDIGSPHLPLAYSSHFVGYCTLSCMKAPVLTWCNTEPACVLETPRVDSLARPELPDPRSDHNGRS